MDAREIVLIGETALLAECGAQALARGHRIRAVITGSARLRDWARTRGIESHDRGGEVPACDWLINIAALDILPEATLARARLAAVNFHDGPLPRYSGLNVPVWALLEGAQSHGVRWHRMSAHVDTGAVLAARDFAIAPDETAFTLNAKCFSAGLESFGDLLTALEQGAEGVPLDLSARRLYRSTDRPAHAGVLDFAQSAEDVARLVRALDFGPYWNPLCLPKICLAGQMLSPREAEALPGTGAPGEVLALGADTVTVACGAGAVRLSGFRGDLGALRVGDILPKPAPEFGPALSSVVAGEAAWRAALSAPALRLGAGAATEALALPQADPEAIIAAFMGALAHVTGQQDFALRYVTRAMQTAPEILSGWVPLRAGADLADQLALAARAPGFARDLLLRDLKLAGVTPPGVAVSDGTTVPDASVILDLGAGVLLHDPNVLPDGQALVAAMAAHLRGAPLPGLAPKVGLCIHHAFEAQVMRSPDATAIVFEGESYTYAGLNAAANRLAHVLRAMGVGPDMPVGLSVARGPRMLIGALGILKAGGAYVPLDPSYPPARLAHMLADSCAAVVVTDGAALPPHGAALLRLESDPRLALAPETNPETDVGPEHLAYLIYTSGSTGMPKGVMVEHGNVANFFAGMDAHIRHDPPGVWLALTSLNFDISVLELFWTLARGFKVVLQGDVLASSPAPVGGMEFSLMYWGNDDGPGRQKYNLLLDGARFADENGFCAVWTPERHFHAFGGPFPNPAVTGAAVAAVTRNLHVRAGSCVAPLHHPARIAEDWAVIDNLTNGRTGLGIASGWHPVDFVLRPENAPPRNKQVVAETIDTLRKLWRGDEVAFDKGDGGMVPVQTLPRPVSPELPIWLTVAGNPDTWAEAGRIGAHVLTHLLGQSLSDVAERIGIYHAALRAAGHDPAAFKVTLMLHTYVAESRAKAREVARGPMKDYLRAATGLVQHYAWAFPAFKRPVGVTAATELDLSSLSEDEVEAILDHAFERYFEESGLFGTIDDCLARVETLKEMGVTEVACLIDYGIASETVLDGLRPLAEVLRRANLGAASDYNIPAQIARHRVTHLQCTPSMARMLCMDDTTRAALAQVPDILLGGEPLPGSLAREIAALTGKPVRNLYGPTETTIWSSTTLTDGAEGTVGIGQPILNTSFHILDAAGQPAGEGELFIGGAGVARGYWGRAELTAERFIPNPFGPGRLYRTGDLVRQVAGGYAFLGRIDHQIKLRGHRIELGEIEAAMEAVAGVRQAVVILREDRPGDARLVGYYTGAPLEPLGAALAVRLPAVMVPAQFVALDAMPLTPNRKIDRAALPAPGHRAPVVQETAPVPIKTGDTMTVLAQIWCDVLGVERVGPRDNFFSLGGHSLLAVQAHREIKARLGLPSAAITDIFRFPVLADLAQHLGGVPKPLPPETSPKDATEQRRLMRQKRMARR